MSPSTLEFFDIHGISDELINNGIPCYEAPLGDGRNKISFRKLKTKFPYLLSIPQIRTEEILEKWAKDSGATILRGSTLLSIQQNDTDVHVTYEKDSKKYFETSKYIVGCDGTNSLVRRLTSISSRNTVYNQSLMHGDVELLNPPKAKIFAKSTKRGMIAIFPLPENRYRLIALDHARMDVPLTKKLEVSEFSESAHSLAEKDFGIHSPLWLQRFQCQQKHAETYRLKRVLLAGDAAHTFLPAGGQGLQVGIQDSFNLAWKLAYVIKEKSPANILDTYEKERRPLIEKVMRHSIVMFRYEISNDFFSLTLKWLANKLMLIPFFQKFALNQMSGLTTNYASLKMKTDSKYSHLIGYKSGDYQVICANGTQKSLYQVLQDGKFILVQPDFEESVSEYIGSVWQQKINYVTLNDMRFTRSENVFLLRPDGFIIWAAKQLDLTSLEKILHKWLMK